MRTPSTVDSLLASLNLGELKQLHPVGGGDISAAWRIECTHGTVFAKTGNENSAPLFLAEAAGLEALARANCLRVPQVLTQGRDDHGAWIVLDWLDIQPSSPAVDAALGRQLAELHRCTSDTYGFNQNTMIGATLQPNPAGSDWIEFYREQRLEFQLRLARQNGFDGELRTLGDRVLERVADFFPHGQPEASLLHGDLWSGNKGACDGQPVVFDPAVYYGDRETDLAMSRLFGGFSATFYTAYEAAWPMPVGHERRVELYQLYHVLNHLNLFGAGYLNRAVSMMRSLLRQARDSGF